MTKEQLSLMIKNYEKQAESNKTKRMIIMFIAISIVIFLIMFLVTNLNFLLSLCFSLVCSLIYLYTGSLVFSHMFLKSMEENKKIEDLKNLYRERFGEEWS
jgi:Flp pilus assembly protein TadB